MRRMRRKSKTRARRKRNRGKQAVIVAGSRFQRYALLYPVTLHYSIGHTN
jgi:hypothetical protein